MKEVNYDSSFYYYDVSFRSGNDSDIELSVYVNKKGNVLRDNYDYVAENHVLPKKQEVSDTE